MAKVTPVCKMKRENEARMKGMGLLREKKSTFVFKEK